MAGSPATPMVVGLRQTAGARNPRRTAAVGEQKAELSKVDESCKTEEGHTDWVEGPWQFIAPSSNRMEDECLP